MHGQKRNEYKARLKDDATATKLATKANQWHILSAEVLRRSATSTTINASVNDSTAHTDIKACMEILKLTDKLLSVNPDPMYLWNRRRQVLLSLLHHDSATTTVTTAINTSPNTDSTNNDTSTTEGTMNETIFIEQEQILTQNALQRNPKAYGAWFHRKWSIRHYIQSIGTSSLSSSPSSSSSYTSVFHTIENLLKAELVLCKEFLLLDERNFHCWNYRRFIIATLGHYYSYTSSTATPLEVDFGLNTIDGGWNFLRSMNHNDHQDDNNKSSILTTTINTIGAQLTKSTSILLSPSSTDTTTNNTTTTTSQTETVSNTIIMEKLQQLLENEWNFTTEKIHQNFSNGSAFHYRTKLLPLLLWCYNNSHNNDNKTKLDLVREEMELIRNAIFTEPDDQTSWWYFRFILSWANPLTCSVEDDIDDNHREKMNISMEEYKDLLYEEWNNIQELVEAEDGQCKWGLLGLYMVAMVFVDLGKNHATANDDGHISQDENWLEHAHSYLEDLKILDPDRISRYQCMQDELIRI